MIVIRCSCGCHPGTGTPGPVLGTVEGHTDPAAPYDFLCSACAGRWAAAPFSSERTIAPLTPVLKVRARCPAEHRGGVIAHGTQT